MSVQSYSYLGGYAGPSIDVNLFPNAQNAGIQAGNAQKTTGQAIAEGISGGIKSGIQNYQGIQEIQKNAQQITSQDATNQVQASDQGIQDRKDILHAQGTLAKIGSDIATATESTTADTAVANGQTQLATAQNAAQTAQTKLQLQQIGSNGDPQQLAGTFQQSPFQQYYAQNPNAAIQNIAQLRQSGQIDPAILDPLQQQYEKLQYTQGLTAGRDGSASHALQYAQSNAADVQKWAAQMATPELQKIMKADNFDPNLLNIHDSPKKGANDPTYHDIRYGDQVVVPHAFTKDERKDADNRLNAWRIDFQNKAGVAPNHLNAPVSASTGTSAQGIGLQQHGTITEKDITPPQKGAIDTKDPVVSNPVVKGAVSIGGFTPDAARAAAPQFTKLGDTVYTLAKTPNPYSDSNKEVLKTAVNSTARAISDANYKSSPELQASITQASVDQFNASIRDQFGARSAAPDFTKFKGGVAPDNLPPVERPHMPTEGFKKGVPTNTAEEDKFLNRVMDLSQAKTPEDFYFLTQGAGLVKQVNDYASKLLIHNKQVQDQQFRSNASQTQSYGVLARMRGG